MDELLNSKVEVSCPECSSTMQASLKQMRDNATVTCPRGHSVRLVMDANSRREIDQADRAMKDLQRTLRNFGR